MNKKDRDKAKKDVTDCYICHLQTNFSSIKLAPEKLLRKRTRGKLEVVLICFASLMWVYKEPIIENSTSLFQPLRLLVLVAYIQRRSCICLIRPLLQLVTPVPLFLYELLTYLHLAGQLNLGHVDLFAFLT